MSDTSTLAPTLAAPPQSFATRLAPLVGALLDAAEAQLAPDAGEFVGRAFVRESIGQFLSSSNRMLVLVAAPGVGKTALAVQLGREQAAGPQPYLAHFCALPDGDNPQQFCLSLARQLQAYLGDEYRPTGGLARQLNVAVNVNVGQAAGDTRVVGVEIKELKLGDVHPREAFRTLVREPLQAYHAKFGAPPGGMPVVILIDALDRVWQWDGGQSANIVSVLSDVQDLPPWVDFICTARPGPAVQALRAQAGVRVVGIDAGERTKNLADIELFLRERLLGTLGADERARLDSLLAASALAGASPSPADELVRRVVDASQGNFSYVRRYAGAWRQALRPSAALPAVDPASLLDFGAASLDSAIEASYAAIYAQIRPSLDAAQGDADEDVVGTLAIAYAPLTAAMVAELSGWRGGADAVAASMARLEPVIVSEGAGDSQTFAFYHHGFAEYVRRSLPSAGRERDLRAARVLEQGGDDPRLSSYGARHRWAHLLRGLDMSAPDASAPRAAAGAPAGAGGLDWRGGLERVRETAPDSVTRAQLLRVLAARALDPSESDARGSWVAALSALREAVEVLSRSRAIVRLRARGWRLDGAAPPPELDELVLSLVALGDAYRVIAQRLDSGGRQLDDWVAERGGLYIVWDAVVRLPLTIYLLITLATQGVREIHIPGALQNLGRGQDWAIARLYVQSVTVYRRARALVRQRGDEDMDDDIVERLARTYTMMGAYDAASATYENLLARPAAIRSPWRQAVWMHALGEVLLSRRRADRAAEVLTNALLTFRGQEAPVLQARALSSLASAHAMQASAADSRGDGSLASQLDDTALSECGEALTAWRDVTSLEGDEGASIDPPLAMSRIANLLWRMAQSSRMAEEQARRADTLRASVEARHYPQRFEHPLLRLFRLASTVIFAATLLLVLLLTVQHRPTFVVNIHTDLALQPPLIDLSLFPNNLITGGSAQPAALTSADLTRLLAGTNSLLFAPPAPRLQRPTFDFSVLTATAVIWLVAYLALYLLFGIGFLLVASPAHYQSRRPGRLILEGDRLVWRGQQPLGIVRDTLRWGIEELQLAAGAARRGLLQVLGIEPPSDGPSARSAEAAFPLADVEVAVSLLRRERGRLLGDFSYTAVELRRPPAAAAGAAGAAATQRSLYIPGSMAFYEELCDELARRLGGRWRTFGADIFRSANGLLFFATLLYTAALAALSSSQSLRALLQWELPLGVGYSLSDLHVIVAPGLMVPLLWWLVVQPLAVQAARGRTIGPLALLAAYAGSLTAAILLAGDDANVLKIQPDLFTPMLAFTLLVALVVHGPPRPLYRALRVGRELVGTLLAALALTGVLAVAQQIGLTVRWYDALVRGNSAIQPGLTALQQCGAGEDCLAQRDAALQRAMAHYQTMICLRPGASDGYSLRGLALVAQGRYADARGDFYSALLAGEGRPPAPPLWPACQPSAPQPLPPAGLAQLHANLAAASSLEAMTQRSADSADPLYQESLFHFLRALSLSEPSGPPGPATVLMRGVAPGQQLSCYDTASSLLGVRPEQMTEELAADMLGAADQAAQGRRLQITPGQAPYLLQVADMCYNRGFARIWASANASQLERQTLRQQAWNDLTSAVAQYTIVRALVGDMADQRQADRGRAEALLFLGQLDRTSPDAPDQHSYLLRAFRAYSDLDRSYAATGDQDETIYAGEAWSIMLLGAWDEAREPLGSAMASAPDSPAYPAMLGFVEWLDSTKFPVATRTNPSHDYTARLKTALALYSRSIELSPAPPSQAYATRAVIYYSLRNSPFADAPAAGPDPEYRDSDYGEWMLRAIGDMDTALLLAEREGLPPAEQVGYRYWRGRLSFTLAVTWQRKLRGLHSWDELAPLYASALGDFSAAAAADPQANRRADYTQLRIPWAEYMFANASHLQLAERAARAGDYAQAERELRLAAPTLTAEQKRRWGPLSEPRPEFSLLHALVSLALDEPPDFVNPQTGSPAASDSFAQALADIQDDSVVDPQLRAPILRQAIADLDSLTERAGLTEAARETAAAARAQLQALLAKAEAGG